MVTRRAKKRQALLEATERELNKIVVATQRPLRPLKGEAQIGLRVGKVLHRFKMAKWIARILAYLGEPTTAPHIAPTACGPPLGGGLRSPPRH